MPDGGLGYQSTSALPRRLEASAPTDLMKSGSGVKIQSQRPGTSG